MGMSWAKKAKNNVRTTPWWTKIRSWVGDKAQRATVLVFPAGRERPAPDQPSFSVLVSFRRVWKHMTQLLRLCWELRLDLMTVLNVRPRFLDLRQRYLRHSLRKGRWHTFAFLLLFFFPRFLVQKLKLLLLYLYLGFPQHLSSRKMIH